MKIVSLLTAGLFLVSSSNAQGNKKEKETVEGNGNLVTREVPVSSFSALKASGVYQLRLSQGSKETVTIEADENLQEYFTVKNEGNKLVIDMKKLENKNFKSKKGLKVYVTFKKLTDMELSTIGDVTSEKELSFDDLKMDNKSVGNINLKLTANTLNLDNKSVGDITLSGKAADAVVKNKGVGSLQAGSFVVQTMNIENTGVGEAEVNAEKNLKVKDSFLGKVKNKGKASAKKMNAVRV